MKYILIFLILTVLTIMGFAQNTLVLKSGETMNGKVERFRNDTLTFKFKGNKIQFKSTEIEAVYFSEKEIIKEKPTSSTSINIPKQEGKISGVVTYFFNKNYGDKPDVGSQVLIINSTNIPNFQFKTVDSFLYAKTYRSLYSSYASRGKVPDDIKEHVKKYGVETKDGFDAFDNRTREELNKIKFKNIYYCSKVTVDGNGTFSANIEPGKYYVYITSNNRTGDSMTEIMGKVYCEEVIVKPNETTTVKAKFDTY